MAGACPEDCIYKKPKKDLICLNDAAFNKAAFYGLLSSVFLSTLYTLSTYQPILGIPEKARFFGTFQTFFPVL